MAQIDVTALNEQLESEDASWRAAPSTVSDLTDRDFDRLLGVVIDRGEVAAAYASAENRVAELVADAPSSIDWRNVGGRSYVSSVKDQKNCGSCVSFCCCSCVESALAIAGSDIVDLSEADLHFNSAHGASCGGWWPSSAYDSLATRGVVDDAVFPYASAFDAAGNPSAHAIANHDAISYKVTGNTALTSMASRKAWIATRGPVAAIIQVYTDFSAVSTGVYRHVSGVSRGYHCVSVIGYDDAQSCWIAKNSWGSGWGDSGFFKIGYGECGIDDTSNDHDADGTLNRFPMYGVNGATAPRRAASWSGWEDLGGIITEGPAAASWAANRLDVFAKGGDNALYHKWWDGSSWGGWESLGGGIDSAPGAVSWGPNRIDVFVRGLDNALYHKWWDGSSWQGYERLGGVLTSGPAAASWAANRLDVFARGADNAMWHLWWDGSAWRGWESLGGICAGAPAAVSWGNGRIDTFVRGTDNNLYHKWFAGSWSGWENLGGVLLSDPTVSSWDDNRLDVFAEGTDGAMWHRWWDGSAWRGWESLGGGITDQPGAVSWGSGRIDTFVRGNDNHMYHKWFG